MSQHQNNNKNNRVNRNNNRNKQHSQLNQHSNNKEQKDQKVPMCYQIRNSKETIPKTAQMKSFSSLLKNFQIMLILTKYGAMSMLFILFLKIFRDALQEQQPETWGIKLKYLRTKMEKENIQHFNSMARIDKCNIR